MRTRDTVHLFALCLALLTQSKLGHAGAEEEMRPLPIDPQPNISESTFENLFRQLELIQGALSQSRPCPTISIDLADSEAAAFCSDPYQAICANPATHRDTENARLEVARKAIIQSVDEKALDFIVKKYGLDSNRIHNKTDLDNLPGTIAREAGDSFTIERHRIKRELMSKVPYFQGIGTDAEIIKKSLIQAIMSSKLPSDAKDRFLAYLSKTTAQSESEEESNFQALREKNRDTALDRELLRSTNGICQSEGLKLGAFSQDSDWGRRNQGTIHVVVCNGYGFSQTDDKDPKLPSGRLAMVLGHEMSHIMSAHWEPDLYKSLYQCVLQTSGKAIFNEYETALKRQGDNSPLPSDNDAPFIQQLVSAHMEEISADYWGKEALIQLLKQDKSRTPEQTLIYLQKSYGHFCGALDSGSHPSGRFRIEMMGWDPKIREIMACKPTAALAHPSCGL